MSKKGRPPDRSWVVVYYDAPADADKPTNFLERCPPNVEAHMIAILDLVVVSPPPKFSGGGYWEAMHGDMVGWYEVRKQGRDREQFRLFCLLDKPATEKDREATGLPGPAIAVITGMRKPWKTTFTDAEYKHVRTLGQAYLQSFPRKIVR